VKIDAEEGISLAAHEEWLSAVEIPFINRSDVSSEHRPSLPVETVSESSMVVLSKTVAVV
jgi:hypothetical protein